MSYYSRLNKSFEGALRLPLNNCTKYVLISDCHRGTGSSNDNFLKNQNLYTAALQYYYRMGYTYIELGDGDELWENRSMEQIIETHSNIFRLLSRFHEQGRLHMLYGNHDIVKKDSRYTARSCTTYPRCCGSNAYLERRPLFPDIRFHAGIILENTSVPYSRNVYLTHGHQADLFNSTFWRFSRFLVRYFWKPLERYGVLDPTSAAKNYTRKQKTEERLHHWARQENHILITGHTHRPTLSEDDPYYYNSGSCVHPFCITCLEIEYMQIRLVKWTLEVRPDMSLYAAREVLAGPTSLNKTF
ncbi:MAG: serine/threonine protein phosphatase [Lachnospiraceae bacterium]|nr:serine/threonine protein phosphatase [Lachnospiraceae bacterium]MBD5456450.1 serine/threonine protein phosphatase [Lachnospiraceae bacterium]